MRKTLSFIVGLSLVWQLAPLAALAVFHEAAKEKRETAKQEVKGKREQLKDEVKQDREAVKQEIQQKRDTLKQEVRDTRDTLKQEVKQKTEAVKEDLKQKRDALSRDLKAKNETLRQELKKRQEAFKTELKEKREAVKQELRDKREKFRDGEKARKEELKKKLGERRGENIEKFFNQMVGKFEAVVARLKDFSDRIASRLNRAEENGRDVVELRRKLAEAGDKIAAVEKALEDAKVRYAEAVKDPDFKVAFKKVREIVESVKEKAQEAHRALVDVISSTKGLGEGERKATTTPTGQ